MSVPPLRLLVITQGMSRIVSPLLSSPHQIAGVLESVPRGFLQSPVRFWLYNIIRLVVRLLISKPLGLQQYCKKSKIPFRFLFSCKDEGLIQWIDDLRPDLIVVFGMSCLLSEAVFSRARLGAINLHPSYLPDYRGPNPDFWQYHDMVVEPGVTIHFIDKGEDTGGILAQKKVPIPLGMRSSDRLDRLVGEAGVALLLQCIDNLALGDVRPIKQGASVTERARNLSKSEHRTVIDFKTWPVERIWNLLRGTEDWLNALPEPKGFLRGQRWRVGAYRKDLQLQGEVGEILRAKEGQFLICRDGVVELTLEFSLKNFLRYILRY